MTTAVIVIAGQSLAFHHFDESHSTQNGVVTSLSNLENIEGYKLSSGIADGSITVTDNGDGTVTLDGLVSADLMAIRFLEQNPEYDDVIMVKAASGGKAVLDQSDPDQPSFFDESLSGALTAEGDGTGAYDGDLMTDLVKANIDTALSGQTDLDFVGVMWSQGEADSDLLGANGGDNPTEEALYKAGVDYVLNEIINYTLTEHADALTAQSSTPTAYIQHIGRRATYGTESGNGLDDVKTIQEELASSEGNIVLATESYDLALVDNVHPTAESYGILAERMALAISSDASTGPTVSDVSFATTADATTITLTLDLPAGADAADLRLGADAKDLLLVRDQGTLSEYGSLEGEQYIPVESVEIVGSTLVFTLSRALQGDGVVTYGYAGALSDDALVQLGDQDTDIEPVYLESGSLDLPLHAFTQSFVAADHDIDAPQLVDSFPSEGSSTARAGTPIVLTFSEPMQLGTGTIELRSASDDSVIASTISIDGTQVTITPDADLGTNAAFYLHIDAGALTDTADHAFAGLTGDDLAFSTLADDAALDAGAIAFIGYNSDDSVGLGEGESSDGFGFVALTDILPGETISFTDQGFDGTALRSEALEDTITWISPGITAGTVVTFERVGAYHEPSIGSLDAQGGVLLSSSGDQIIAYTGDSATPTFLAALDMSGGFGADASLTGGTELPSGLVEGESALSITPEIDNAYYSGPTSFTSQAEALAAINDPANWTTSDNGPLDIATLWSSAMQISEPLQPELTLISDAGTDFGDLASGESVSLTYTIRNDGLGDLVVSEISVSGDASGDFIVSGFTGGTVAPGATAQVTVTATALASGARTASLQILSNDADEAVSTLTLSATADIDAPSLSSSAPSEGAAAVDLDPQFSLTFDEAIFADTGSIRLIKIDGATETEIEALDIADATINGAELTFAFTAALEEDSQYRVTLDNGAVLDGFGNAAQPINGGSGLSFSTLSLEPEITVLGNGIVITDGDSSADASDHTAFDALIGGETQTRSFTIRNDGDDDLNVASIGLSGTAASAFALSGFTAGTIAAGASATFSVTFTPSEDGLSEALVTIASDDADEAAYSFAISGNADVSEPSLVTSSPSEGASDVALDPVITLTFDEEITAGSGSIRLVQIIGGVETEIEVLDISDAAIDGTDLTISFATTLEESTDYRVTLDEGAVLDAAGNAAAPVNGGDGLSFSTATYLPEATILGNGIVITDGDSSADASDHTAFDALIAGQSQTRTFTIRNDGDDALNVASIGISGTDAADFALSGFSSGTIAAGESASFSVTFTPSADGDADATVTVYSDDEDEASYSFAIAGSADVTAPTLISSSPSQGDLDVALDAIATLVFDSEILAGTGSIHLYENGSLIESIDVADATILVDTLTVIFAQDFSEAASYTLQVDAGALTDTVGNPIAALSGSDAIAFSTLDLVPEITALGQGIEISDADTSPSSADGTDFGTTTLGTPVERSFTLRNDGADTLTVHSVAVNGLDRADFSIAGFTSGTIEPGETATFTVTYNADAEGASEAQVEILNDDADEALYSFAITATGEVVAPPPDLTVFEGTDSRDVHVGTEENDTIDGNGGNDKLAGAGGDDAISGGTGNDAINGGADNDTIYGNEGNDILAGGDGDDTVYAGNDDDFIFGGNGDDALYGNAGIDRIFGGAGNDTIYGGEGDDVLAGRLDDDSIFGGAGNDVLIGGGGINYIDGGAGDDQIGAAIGETVLVFSQANFGNDTVFGADIDKLSFSISSNLASSFEDITLTPEQNGQWTVVSFAGGSVTLVGVAPEEVTAEDFLFD